MANSSFSIMLPVLAILALIATPRGAAAQATTFDFGGYSWGGGVPGPGSPGDTLHLVTTFDVVPENSGIDLSQVELTAWISTGPSFGAVDIGGGIIMVRYAAGRMEVYQDPSRDHDYGTFPPNGTSPSTFQNGEVCFMAEFGEFFLLYDPSTGTGAFEFNAYPTGPCVASMQVSGAYVFGSLAGRATFGNIPDGYLLQCDGIVEFEIPIPTICTLPCLRIQQADVFRQAGGSLAGLFLDGSFSECTFPPTLAPWDHPLAVWVGTSTWHFDAKSWTRSIESGREIVRNAGARGDGSGWKVAVEHVSESVWRFSLGASDLPIDSLIGAGDIMTVLFRFEPDAGYGHVQIPLLASDRGWEYAGLESMVCGEPGFRPPPGSTAPRRGGGSVQLLSNPARGTASFLVHLQAGSSGRLQVFDVRGRLVRTLHAGFLSTGAHSLRWPGVDDAGRALPAGIYLYRFESSAGRQQGKFALVR